MPPKASGAAVVAAKQPRPTSAGPSQTKAAAAAGPAKVNGATNGHAAATATPGTKWFSGTTPAKPAVKVTAAAPKATAAASTSTVPISSTAKPTATPAAQPRSAASTSAPSAAPASGRKKSPVKAAPPPAVPPPPPTLPPRHVDPVAVQVIPPPAAVARPRSASGVRTRSPSPIRRNGSLSLNRGPGSSFLGSSVNRASSYHGGGGTTMSSRVDTHEARLRYEEELWQSHRELVADHRSFVKQQAQALDEAYRHHAESQLKNEGDANARATRQARTQWRGKMDHKHELERRQRELVSLTRQLDEERLANFDHCLRNDLTSAERRHRRYLDEVAAKTNDRLSQRFSRVGSNLQQMVRSLSQRSRDMELSDSDRNRRAELETSRRRSASMDKSRTEHDKVALTLLRSRQLEETRREALLQQQRAIDARSRSAQDAHWRALQQRQDRKAEKAEEIAKSVAGAKAAQSAREDYYAQHFEETLMIGDATRAHNANVHQISVASRVGRAPSRTGSSLATETRWF